MKKQFLSIIIVVLVIISMIECVGCEPKPVDPPPSGDNMPSGENPPPSGEQTPGDNNPGDNKPGDGEDNSGDGEEEPGDGENNPGEENPGDGDSDEDKWDDSIDYSKVYTVEEGVITGMTAYGETLTHVVIPEKVGDVLITEIGAKAFMNNEKIQRVRFATASALKINTYAFWGCDNLKSVEFSSGVNDLAIRVLGWCTSLEKISVDESNEKYMSEGNCVIEKESKRLVYGCKTSKIPNYVTSIGTYAFGEQATLESIQIPIEVESIESYAFYGCSSLKSIEIPSGIKSLAAGAFYDCSKLRKIVIPANVEIIEKNAFYGCSGATLYCEAASKPDGFVDGMDADRRQIKWYQASNVQVLPVVWDCKNNELDEQGNIHYYSEDGLHYSLKDGNATVLPQAKDIVDAKIKSVITYKNVNYDVTVIYDRAFWQNNKLKSVVIPASVTAINANAFRESSIESITFESGSQLSKIGTYAFNGCTRLKSIVIPLSTANIASNAFKGCSSMTEINCEADSKPAGWGSTWNPDNINVVWGYKAN